MKLKLKNQIAKWFWFVLRPFDYAQDKRAYRVLRIAYVGTDLNTDVHGLKHGLTQTV